MILTKAELERYLDQFDDDDDEEVDMSDGALHRFLRDEEEYCKRRREDIEEECLKSYGCYQQDVIDMYRRER